MKKFCISLGIILIIILTVVTSPSNDTDKYLRIHIRANSNSYFDQSIKYQIKDGIVKYLTPLLAECIDKKLAMDLIKSQTDEIAFVADSILKSNGLTYTASARLSREEFPHREYNGLALESGIYDSLIVDLGSGSGDNWWCVVYPPLCFQGEGEGKIEYQSKILEIIENFKQKYK